MVPYKKCVIQLIRISSKFSGYKNIFDWMHLVDKSPSIQHTTIIILAWVQSSSQWGNRRRLWLGQLPGAPKLAGSSYPKVPKGPLEIFKRQVLLCYLESKLKMGPQSYKFPWSPECLRYASGSSALSIFYKETAFKNYGSNPLKCKSTFKNNLRLMPHQEILFRFSMLLEVLFLM